jgi:hypothetical protein
VSRISPRQPDVCAMPNTSLRRCRARCTSLGNYVRYDLIDLPRRISSVPSSSERSGPIFVGVGSSSHQP